MMKRSNPFGECSPLQFKTRIGKKEIDLGVGQKENMKIVYEKTKELLFKGSQKSFSEGAATTDANDNMICQPMAVERSVDEILPGQLCLDKGCQLTPPQFPWMSNGGDCQKNSSTVISPKEAGLFCNTCKNSVTKLSSQPCSFCDKLACKSCTRQCDNCAGDFCQLCSVLNYDEAMERSFCLSCS
ncbi:apoptosis regulatory protein Siva-like [Gigantopelta aegis]|uniref:apoptosis regulatory protein Siva-like n=1 Tax=Gigantopelta aegis TaxID=1735272 RepID=UPI001B889DCD|nr:apoptosis regulatory protein Siva-like [Gigantopelta aegis]